MRSLDYSFIHLKFSQHSWFFHTNEFYQYTNFWVQLGSKVGTLDISFHSHWVHLVKKELTLLIFLQITGNLCDTIPENVLLISNNIIEGVNTQLKLPTLFHSLLLDTLELPLLKKKILTEHWVQYVWNTGWSMIFQSPSTGNFSSENGMNVPDICMDLIARP